MKTLLLSAPEIHCDACKKILRMAFSDLRTVDNVQIDVGTKRIQCDYDEVQITEEHIIAHLEEETSFKIKKITKDE